MRITSYQLKAARGMVGLSVIELAKLANVSRDVIDDFESEKTTPRKKSLDALWSVLQSRGVELIGDRQIAMRDESMRRLSGAHALRDFLDDVYVTVMNGGDICVTGVDEDMFDHHIPKDDVTHSSRMKALGDKLSMRCILREGDINFAYDSYIKYRWMSHEEFDASPMYMYNHKLAMIDFTKNEPNIVILEAQPIAHAFRKQFDFIWKHCKEVPKPRKV